MSYILHIETATDICSVGLSKDTQLLCLQEADRPYDHAAQITLLIQSCLRKADLGPKQLDAVSLSSGPGSYTALRVGSSTAKALCFSLDIPLVIVSTLESLARAVSRKADPKTWFCPMIDARRMEVYTALFSEKCEILEGPKAMVITEDSFREHFSRGRRILFCGNGAEKCRSTIRSPMASFEALKCSAEHLVPLAWEAFEKGEFADIAYYNPLYLKPPNVTKPRRRL